MLEKRLFLVYFIYNNLPDPDSGSGSTPKITNSTIRSHMIKVLFMAHMTFYALRQKFHLQNLSSASVL